MHLHEDALFRVPSRLHTQDVPGVIVDGGEWIHLSMEYDASHNVVRPTRTPLNIVSVDDLSFMAPSPKSPWGAMVFLRPRLSEGGVSISGAVALVPVWRRFEEMCKQIVLDLPTLDGICHLQSSSDCLSIASCYDDVINQVVGWSYKKCAGWVTVFFEDTDDQFVRNFDEIYKAYCLNKFHHRLIMSFCCCRAHPFRAIQAPTAVENDMTPQLIAQ